jgi:hypothetical protein
MTSAPIRMTGFPDGGHRMVSVHEAVEDSIEHDGVDAARWIGRIVEVLNDNGAMSEADIQDLLSPRYKFL